MLLFQQVPDFSQLSHEGWLSIFYLGIGCTSMAYVLYIYASKSVSPAVLNVILLLNVIIGLILSTLLLGDNFSVYMILGSIIILVAIYLANESEKS
jgi:drug/metabolite transporter (DMT)-like permease